MQKLRGTGTTFSTSRKRWYPFRGNPKVAARNAKLRRLIAAGKLQPLTKDQMRDLAAQAVNGALPGARRRT